MLLYDELYGVLISETIPRTLTARSSADSNASPIVNTTGLIVTV